MSAVEGTEVVNLPTSVDALIAHLREADSGGENDVWLSADLALAAIRDKLPKTAPGSGGFKNTDAVFSDLSFQSQAARDAADEITDTLREKGILINGNDAKTTTLLTWAKTAHVWPRDDRVKGAPFYAHRALNSPKYDRIRQQRLQRLVNKSGTGRITETAVRDWIRDRKPAEKQTFLEKVERRVRKAVRAAADPWEKVAPGDRDQIARTLRTIANEIEAGTFQ